MAVQVASAAQAVGEHLQSPDDLMKIAAFRKKLEEEKDSIDVKLRNGVKDQLDATREGLKKLLNTRNSVQVLKDEMLSVDRACSDPQYRVKTFDAIRRVSLVHCNFTQTKEMVKNRLQEMYWKLEMLEDMLEADHTWLEAFRNETLQQAKKASADARNTLDRYFEGLNTLLEAFDEYVWALAKNVLPIVRAGNGSVIVKLVKTSEIEGKEDEKAIAIRPVKRMAAQDAASKFKSMQANARVIKHYRSKFVKCITESMQEKFKAYEQDKNEPGMFLDNLGWIYQDLIRIEENVVPCFPPDDTIKQLVASEPEASVLLVLHAWLKEYKKNMKELNIPDELLEPPILGGKEQSLIDDYVGLIIRKLDEWSANLMKDEVKDFTMREQSPEQDTDGLYGMQGAVIMFQMVNQQVDAAIESGQGAVLARREQWVKVLEAEYKKQVDRPDEQAGGLVDYVIAVANDQIKSADYAEALEACLKPLVSAKYQAPISEKLNEATEGYLDVAKKCTQTLIDLIFNDLRPATKVLFAQGWYDGIMLQIVETMRNYMLDYQSFLNPLILELLKMPQAIDRIRDDVGEAFEFFASFKAAELEVYFEIIELSMVFLEFWCFAGRHGPNLPFVEAVIRARDDLDRSGANEVMETIKQKVREENVADPPEATIMKKVTVPGVFSRFLPTTK
ncbi:exocyst complex component Sec6 [Auricularia subglabra TFB-10046 SS5]|uniref:Exocyst complex component Sec6 n=1 Tax=Auricularia subglabra (strain TFB-10046 / SS5) TaxID=717982 RepID=J0CWK7_AURST|nr:exocyst complex component Sec6 [Auricularia subglabra TFB-10046 SS5]